MSLRALADGLWVTERPLRFLGLPVGARMTVIALDGGQLLLHSPVAPDPGLESALAARGAVRWVLAPNKFHHLFVGAWAGPGRELWAAPGLARKRPDVAWAGTVGEGPPPWGDAVPLLATASLELTREVVLLHRASRTLVLTDLAFHFGPDAPFVTRVAMGAACAYPGFRASAVERLLMKRSAARAELDAILAWDFDRIIVAHGHVLERGGKDALAAAYAWL